MRHFDRGWHQLDDGAYDRAEYVFGACAAAALYRRQMIDDVSIDGDFFDPDFFAYREDADVAWRAQLLGWRCIYAPAAVGWHVRSVVPGKRRSITPSINMHSVKNRFLMRIKNATPGLYRHCWLPMTARDWWWWQDACCWNRRSLPALLASCKVLGNDVETTEEIMSRRRVSDQELVRWFRFDLTGEPLTHGTVTEAGPGYWHPTQHKTYFRLAANAAFCCAFFCLRGKRDLSFLASLGILMRGGLAGLTTTAAGALAATSASSFSSFSLPYILVKCPPAPG